VLYKSEKMLSFKRGEITENEYWDFVRKELNINLSNNELFNILRDSYETNGKIVDIVRLLKKKGYKTCICSNNFETRIRELNKSLIFSKTLMFTFFLIKSG